MGLKEIAIEFRAYLEDEIDDLANKRLARGETVYAHRYASGDLGALQWVHKVFRNSLFYTTETTPEGSLLWSPQPVADLNETDINRQLGLLDSQIAAKLTKPEFERIGANDDSYNKKLTELKREICDRFGYLLV